MQINKNSIISSILLAAIIIIIADLVYYSILSYHSIILYIITAVILFINIKDFKEKIKFVVTFLTLLSIYMVIQHLANDYIQIELTSVHWLMIVYIIIFVTILLIWLITKLVKYAIRIKIVKTLFYR